MWELLRNAESQKLLGLPSQKVWVQPSPQEGLMHPQEGEPLLWATGRSPKGLASSESGLPCLQMAGVRVLTKAQGFLTKELE